MFRKSLSLLMALVMALALVPTVAFAATPPTTIKAPKNIGTTFYYNACWFVTTMSAQDDLRAILSQTAEERGYSVQVNAQVDFKIDSGDWHYTSEWDTDPMKYATAYYNNINEVSAQRFGKFIGAAGRINYKYLFPDDPQLSEDNVGEWLKSHTVTTRARYMLSFNGGSAVFSDWSETYTVTGKAPVDFKGIINSSKPTLTSSALEYYAGKPQMNVLFTEPSDAIQKLSAAAGGTILTEVWLRKDGDKEFKKIGDWSMNEEKIAIDVGAYFPGTSQKEFDAAKYEVRTRYVFRSSNYFPAYEDVFYYSPFSNIIAYNMPAWADASAWATDTLKKADELGLIPDVLKGADLKKPITRKEFAAVCVKIYENLSGTMTTPFSPNPFTDTNDTEVLKAYNFGLMVGTAADKFSPDTILNREQAATALTNVLKRNLPGWQKGVTYTLNFTQPAKFADDAKISDWAKPSVYFMAANGIIAGTGNNMFSPRATTSAEEAVNYASATREQALVIAVRMVENLKGKTLDYTQGGGSTTPEQPTQPSGNNSLAGTVWSKYPDSMDWWYEKMDGIEGIIPRGRSYANSWIFNNDGTFVLTMRWLTGYGTAYQMGGVLVTRGKYQVINDTQFKLTDMSTNRTTGPYYGDVTGWFAEKGEINCEYQFFTDEDGEGIKIKMDGVGIIVKDSPLGEYDNTWSNYWKRTY